VTADLEFGRLMDRLHGGDDAAAAVVFERFVQRLLALAHSQLDTWLRSKVDPEDVVQSVCKSFFRRHRDGPLRLADWDSLWSLLAVITVRKCANQAAYWQAQRRNPRFEADLPAGDDFALCNVLSREPTPSEAAVLTETVERLMRDLRPREREILVLHLQGHDVAETAARVGRTQRTVRRALERGRAKLCRLQAEAC